MLYLVFPLALGTRQMYGLHVTFQNVYHVTSHESRICGMIYVCGPIQHKNLDTVLAVKRSKPYNGTTIGSRTCTTAPSNLNNISGYAALLYDR